MLTVGKLLVTFLAYFVCEKNKTSLAGIKSVLQYQIRWLVSASYTLFLKSRAQHILVKFRLETNADIASEENREIGNRES